MAEDRERFRIAMEEIGLDMPRAAIAHSLEEAYQVQAMVGYPTIIRPSFTMGGSGGGIAYNRDEFEEICRRGLDLSPVSELLVEESVLGWKEYEMEVVRDNKDNCIIICSIENLDPMGIHTGDSITVAPAQTLTDKEYQRMRDASIAVLRKIGVDTGGSNVQFSVCPDDGRMTIIVPRRWHPKPQASPSPGWRRNWRSAIRSTNCRTKLPAVRHRPRSSRRLTMWSPRSRASLLKNSRRRKTV
jgi:carbamoyl-phosphate synthase large subunit